MNQRSPEDMPTPRGTDFPTPPAPRPGPEDREAAIDRLSAAFAEDHLSTEELESRVAAAYRATTHDGLARLTADLPVAAREAGADPTRPSMASEISTLLGSVERRGPTIVPPRLRIRSILGNIALDLREAEFHEGVTEIAVQAFLGNVEVVLPHDVAIECHGSALLGNFAHSGTGARPGTDAASGRAVRITGRAVLGNVEFGGDPRRLRRGGRNDGLG